MISLFKAIPCGLLLTALVCLFIGSETGTGGTLSIIQLRMFDYQFYWSWLLLLGSTGLAWILIGMMGD